MYLKLHPQLQQISFNHIILITDYILITLLRYLMLLFLVIIAFLILEGDQGVEKTNMTALNAIELMLVVPKSMD